VASACDVDQRSGRTEQLMPATAVTFGVTNRFDVEQNIRGGVALLGLPDEVIQR
jgi:membrane-bound lytic murein transglycosylase MltF